MSNKNRTTQNILTMETMESRNLFAADLIGGTELMVDSPRAEVQANECDASRPGSAEVPGSETETASRGSFKIKRQGTGGGFAAWNSNDNGTLLADGVGGDVELDNDGNDLLIVNNGDGSDFRPTAEAIDAVFAVG